MRSQFHERVLGLCALAVQKFPEAAAILYASRCLPEDRRDAFAVLNAFVSSHWDRQVSWFTELSREQRQSAVLLGLLEHAPTRLDLDETLQMMRAVVPVDETLIKPDLDGFIAWRRADD